MSPPATLRSLATSWRTLRFSRHVTIPTPCSRAGDPWTTFASRACPVGAKGAEPSRGERGPGGARPQAAQPADGRRSTRRSAAPAVRWQPKQGIALSVMPVAIFAHSDRQRFSSAKSCVTSCVGGRQSPPWFTNVAISEVGGLNPYNSLNKKPSRAVGRANNWVQGLDLNQRPSGYEPDELPGCSTLHQGEGQRAGGHLDCQEGFSRDVAAVVTPLGSRLTTAPAAWIGVWLCLDQILRGFLLCLPFPLDPSLHSG